MHATHCAHRPTQMDTRRMCTGFIKRNAQTRWFGARCSVVSRSRFPHFHFQKLHLTVTGTLSNYVKKLCPASQLLYVTHRQSPIRADEDNVITESHIQPDTVFSKNDRVRAPSLRQTGQRSIAVQEKRVREVNAQEGRQREVTAQEKRERGEGSEKARERSQGSGRAREIEAKAWEEREREAKAREELREEVMKTQEKCVEAKKETNSMHEENDVSNRHMTWWRNAWWIRVDSGPHMWTGARQWLGRGDPDSRRGRGVEIGRKERRERDRPDNAVKALCTW